MLSASGIFTTGAKSSISTTALQITATSTKCVFGVSIKADADNTGIVYVGPKGVTAGSADATDGYKLKAGEEVFVQIDDPSKVYVIASAAAQKVWWVAI